MQRNWFVKSKTRKRGVSLLQIRQCKVSASFKGLALPHICQGVGTVQQVDCHIKRRSTHLFECTCLIKVVWSLLLLQRELHGIWWSASEERLLRSPLLISAWGHQLEASFFFRVETTASDKNQHNISGSAAFHFCTISILFKNSKLSFMGLRVL